jgi:hypothetical protein
LRRPGWVQILEPSANPTDPLQTRCSVPVATEPFGLALAPDDRTLLVTHAWARKLSAATADREEPLTIIDKPVRHPPRPLAKKAPEPAAPPPRRIFAPMVSVDPGETTVRSSGYGSRREETLAMEEPMVGVIDVAAERSMTGSVLDLGMRREPGCLLPRAAAVSERTGMLFVTCLGVDTLVELDALKAYLESL